MLLIQSCEEICQLWWNLSLPLFGRKNISIIYWICSFLRYNILIILIIYSRSFSRKREILFLIQFLSEFKICKIYTWTYWWRSKFGSFWFIILNFDHFNWCIWPKTLQFTHHSYIDIRRYCRLGNAFNLGFCNIRS